MKKSFGFFIALIVTSFACAQTPEKMSYQSVIRDASESLIQNSNIGTQISIRQGSVSGTIVFQEQHTTSTNQNGLISIEIGDGTSTIGSFSAIDWGNGPYFIHSETDPFGGTNYSISGTSQLLSVPYALFSKLAENVENDQVNDADADPNNEIQNLSINGTNLTISSANTVDLSSLQDGVNDADADPNNEIQNLSVNGTNLTISSANTIDLSSIQDGVNDADADPNNEIQVLSFSNDTMYLSNGGQIFLGAYAIDLIDDADNDPTNEIELPSNANAGDLLEFNGSNWVAFTPTASSSPGALMYIYNGQSCPTGWNTQQINVAIFGGAPVDACYTDSPCLVMYIYDGQTCPAGWTNWPIGVSILNGTNVPMDACFKCN
ncbi:MAG: hypothetical protein VXY47_07960 [Bacteroidota bacterium]|nr:hypothetical protein [Bacteroidota bacterium]